MEERSQFQYCPNFSNLTIHQAKVANYSNTISSAICLTILILLLGLLVLYKAYKTTLQRLFLYYTTAVAINNAVQVLNVELQFDVNRSFCSWLAFLWQWWYMTVQLFALILVVYLSVATYKKLRSRPLLPCLSKIPQRCAVVMEVLYTGLVVLLPLVYVWIPMKQHKYGLSQTICWMKTHDESCSQIYEGVSFYEMLISILQLIVTIVFLMLIVMFHLVILKKYQQNRESKSNMLCRAAFLLAVFIISTIAELSENIVNLPHINPYVNTFLYDLIDGLIDTITTTLLPLALAVYIYSPNKLKLRSLKKAAREWCDCNWTCSHCHQKRHSRNSRARDPRVDEIENEDLYTFESSVDYSAPSHTTYSSPYTNEFTNITEIISNSDTEPKYGSTLQYEKTAYNHS